MILADGGMNVLASKDLDMGRRVVLRARRERFGETTRIRGERLRRVDHVTVQRPRASNSPQVVAHGVARARQCHGRGNSEHRRRIAHPPRGETLRAERRHAAPEEPIVREVITSRFGHRHAGCVARVWSHAKERWVFLEQVIEPCARQLLLHRVEPQALPEVTKIDRVEVLILIEAREDHRSPCPSSGPPASAGTARTPLSSCIASAS